LAGACAALALALTPLKLALRDEAVDDMDPTLTASSRAARPPPRCELVRLLLALCVPEPA
jgi:hypothetical protein